jgi:hypothetical protein
MKVTLVFTTSKQLWAFKVATHADCVQVNTELLTLICDCSETDIALAVREYEAHIESEAVTF